MGRRIDRSPAWFLLAAMFGTAACATPRPTSPRPDTLFSDYLPADQHGVSTDVIDTADPFPADLLGAGWEPLTKKPKAEDGRLVVARSAGFRLYAVTTEPHALELDGMTVVPPPRQQSFAVFVNGRQVGNATMTKGWRTYVVPLPANVMQIGWNNAELQFASTVALDAGSGASTDSPSVAAAFRQIRLRPALGRTVWTDRPDSINVRSDSSGVNLVEMPADSVLNVHLALGKSARLVGALEIALARGSATPDLKATIDVIDGKGISHAVFDRTYSSNQHESFDVPLDKWSSSTVRFRLRAWGKSNGIVRWRNVGLLASEKTVQPPRSGELHSSPRSNRLGRPNIVVMLLDTARADAFDGSRSGLKTPHVAALAQEGTRFTQAWAPSAWTAQSLPSLMTGWYPHTLGVDNWGSQIPASVPTLAELLGKNGYRTVLWTHHTFWRVTPTAQRGFQIPRILGAPALSTRDKLPSAAELFAPDKPTFAMVHVLPPHSPYTPPRPFRGSLTASLEKTFAAPNDREIEPPSLRKWTGKDPATDGPSAELVRYIRRRYDENAAYADHLVGRLVETIRAAGQYDNTLIVILSDHGEAFFEHRRFVHQTSAYQELLHVPFIVKWPASVRTFARQVTDPVTLVDLVPTLVDGLGLQVEKAVFQGQTLLPLALDGTPLERDVFANTRPDLAEKTQLHAVRSGRYKVIFNDASRKAELYDLETDPAEQMDLAAKDQVLAGSLLQRLLLRRDGNLLVRAKLAGGPQNPLEDEALEALKALGYVQ